MKESGAYGDAMAQRFRLDRAHSSQLVRIDSGASFAITRLVSGATGFARSLPIPPERALVVVLQLRPLLKHALWFGQRSKPVEPWPTGAVSVVDLEADPSASVAGEADVLQFYLPRSSLELVAADNGVRSIGNLEIPDGTIDPTIHQLGRLMLPVLKNPDHANILFLSGLTTALHAHLSQTYAGISPGHSSEHCGLTDAQLSRAKEIIAANLLGDLALSTIASECRLPASLFACAFKKATGMRPDEWLLVQRVERAKELISKGQLNWQEIALMCGFSDKYQFVGVFSAIVGTTPSKWKAAQRSLRHKI
jgi:AraC family transcriptional regulator